MPTIPTDRRLPRALHAIAIGVLSIGMFTVALAGPVPAAHANTWVSSETALRNALADSISPLILGTSFTVITDNLTVSANTTIELNDKTLTTRNIIVNPGVTLTINSAGAQGALTVVADNAPGIETTGATLTINGGTIWVSSDYGHAGIGGAETGGDGRAGGTTIINGGDVTIRGGGAGIGGGEGASNVGANGGDGGDTTINGGHLDVRGSRGAGIGGGAGGIGAAPSSGGSGGDGGITRILGGTVEAYGGDGAGIGGGRQGDTDREGLNLGFGGDGGTVVIRDAAVIASGARGAGVGGGRGGSSAKAYGGPAGHGGTLTVESGSLRATGFAGAGIGGGDAGWGLLGDGWRGNTSTIRIDSGAHVTATRDTATDTRPGHFEAVGFGKGNSDSIPPNPLTIDGTLVLSATQQVFVPSGASITGAGTIVGDTAGGGAIENDGIITPQVHDDVTVTGNNHYVTFDSGSSQVTPRTRTVRVLATNFDDGERDFPADPVITGNPFTGWNTSADGSGTTATETTTLSGNPTFYGQWTYDTYELAPDVPAPHPGDQVTFSVAAEDGDPAGDQSGQFTFTTDAPGTAFTGNQVTFTGPGDWTITATHQTTPSIVLTMPITVTTDRTAAVSITLNLSATTLDVDGTITATVTGTDAYSNPLGDLTDLATISSNGSGDTVTQGSLGTPGSIHFATPGSRTITAAIGTVTDAVDVAVDAEDYTLVADVPSPLAGDEVTFSITADDGDPAGNLASDFSFETTGPGATAAGNPVTLTTAGDWTVTATHTVSGTQATLPLTVGTDRTAPADIRVNLSAFSVKVGGTITATITGTDAYGNPLGDLTDLATITSDHASDVIGADGSIRFPTASTHIITAAIGAVTHSAAVTVIPAASPGSTAIPHTGTDPAPAAVTATALLAFGAALLTAARLRQRRR